MAIASVAQLPLLWLCLSGVAALPSHSQITCTEPLNVSPLIKQGRIAEAIAALAVKDLDPLFDGTYAGMVTTNDAKKDALWFWFLPALSERSGGPAPKETPPTLVWLQGGPGAPSTYGMFTEIGPVIVGNGSVLKPRNETWNKNIALLIVDNPSGVGFSRLGDPSDPVRTEDEVGQQMVQLLRQWTLLFPERQHADLILAGESYGGKYAPSAAQAVDEYNTVHAVPGTSNPSINIKALVVADGWCDPATHAANYASMMYGQGLFDAVQRDIVETKMQDTISHIHKGNLVDAFDPWNSVWKDYGGDYPNKSFVGPGLFTNFTGGTNTENIWVSGEDPNIPNFAFVYQFLDSAKTRCALHIGNSSMGEVDQYAIMIASGDVMNTSKPAIEHVLNANKYKVLAYSGAWDGVLGAAVSEPLYASLKWPGNAAFNAGARHPYRVAPNDEQVAGYARTVVHEGTQFTRVVIRNAGHILPADQPRASRDMIERFVFDRGFVTSVAPYSLS